MAGQWLAYIIFRQILDRLPEKIRIKVEKVLGVNQPAFSPITHKGKLVNNKKVLLIIAVWSTIVGVTVVLLVKSGFNAR